MANRKRDIEPAELARQVNALYRARQSNSKCDRTDTSHADARRVANGLAFINQLLERELANLKQLGDWRTLSETGLLEALEIIEALTTGKNHPIHRYRTGSKAAGLKLQNPPPTNIERLRRTILIGLVRAYSEAHAPKKVSMLSARKAVSEYYRWDRLKLTVGTLERWERDFLEEGYSLERIWADFIAEAEGLQADGPLPEKIFRIADRYVYALFGTAR